eukprot:1146063-Pelagomonas_calceolata.AAC.20
MRAAGLVSDAAIRHQAGIECSCNSPVNQARSCCNTVVDCGSDRAVIPLWTVDCMLRETLDRVIDL